MSRRKTNDKQITPFNLHIVDSNLLTSVQLKCYRKHEIKLYKGTY